MKSKFVIGLIAGFMISMMFIPWASSLNTFQFDETSQEHPKGWTHRPLAEHFTGLSCPPCMSGAHPDSTKLWEEEGYTKGYPWNYIEFHELNGGGEDDLMTDESRERMRYYQPGVSGTPDLEIDGGYVQCGGSHASSADANYDDIKQAIYDSGERDAIKKVNIDIRSMYDGISFVMNITVEYLENNEPFFPTVEEPIPDDTLRGSLYVFMVEDNVTAWSTTNEEFVTCHNVFREHAIFDLQFDMEIGDTFNKLSVWEVPTTMIIDGDEEPIKVPINPKNVFPLAAVYNLDDTSSGRGDGSENNDGADGDGSPRALNSATPLTTKYDHNDVPPKITVMDPTSQDGNAVVNVLIEDDGGELAGAYVLYREATTTNDTNNTHWFYRPLTIDGEECEGDVCTLGSGEASAVLNLTDDTAIEFSIIAYDGNWTKGETQVEMYGTPSNPKSDDDSSIGLIGGTIAVIAIIGFVAYLKFGRKEED